MIVTRKPMLSLSYLNESSFNPPLASTPITDRKKPTSLQFVDSLTMSTKTPSTASSATPASPAPQVAKRRRTSSGDGKSVRIQEKTPEQKDDDVEMAEEEVNETNGTSVEDNLANLLETSVHLTEATINTNKDNHLKTAEEITLPIREPSLVEAVNDEKEPISDETQRKSEDFTIGVAHTFGQTLNANATEDIDNFTFGPEPPKVAQTLTDNVTLGQNNLSQILLGVGDQFSIQTLPQDATGIASVNVTQATATRKNATQMLYESLLDDRPFFLADFVGDENDSLAKLLHIIEQAKVDEWREVLPNDTFNNIKKLGEGVYGEVFATTWNGAPTAIKIIPFRADNVIDEAKVNGEFLKFAADIIPEVLITRELSGLSNTGSYQTSNFIELLQARVVKGNYPEEFLEAWDVFAGRKGGSENDRPDTYSTDERLYIVIALSMGGIDIEHYTPRNENEVFSLLLQISFALMAAERELCFEHRDLHVGNVLVKQTEDEYIEYRMNGLPLRIRSHGVKANIIDFTNSRLSKAGVNIYLDLEEDQELFQGQGHYQFDIYRMMQAHNGGNWCDFNPKSNVFWIHYMSKELLSRVAKKRITPKRKKQLEAIFDKVLMFDELSAFVYDEVMNDVCEKYLVE
ncbi:unnamed protein product, partial [Mesorhabditis belari]|uniref:non-specific serine/threonine protein kinase n=1 Tax=Mesorhabditis belari TaxID=2138241 RepID=A0AAF3J6U8_9BILA